MHPLLYNIGTIKLHLMRKFAAQCPRVVLDWCTDVRDIGIYSQSPSDPIRVQHVYAMCWADQLTREAQLISATRSAPVPHVHVVRVTTSATSTATCLQLRALLTGRGLDFAWLDLARTPVDAFAPEGLDRLARTLSGLCVDAATVVCMLVDAQTFRQLVLTSSHPSGLAAPGPVLRLGVTTLRVASCTEDELTRAFCAHGFSIVFRSSATEALHSVNVNIEPRDAVAADAVRFVVFRSGLRL